MDGTIEHIDRANKLIAGTSIVNREACGAVGQGETLVCPTPVPNLRNSCYRVGHGYIAHSELLVPNVKSIKSTSGGDVVQEASGPFEKMSAGALSVARSQQLLAVL